MWDSDWTHITSTGLGEDGQSSRLRTCFFGGGTACVPCRSTALFNLKLKSFHVFHRRAVDDNIWTRSCAMGPRSILAGNAVNFWYCLVFAATFRWNRATKIIALAQYSRTLCWCIRVYAYLLRACVIPFFGLPFINICQRTTILVTFLPIL